MITNQTLEGAPSFFPCGHHMQLGPTYIQGLIKLALCLNPHSGHMHEHMS